jgi:23S rRNA pseudouridine1911/1915/1917 synthase
MKNRKPKSPPPDLSRPENEWVVEVPCASAGERLDRFLSARLPWRSRSRIQREIADGLVLVDDSVSKPSCNLKGGEIITITLDTSAISDQDPSKIEIDIIYEDEHIVALNKRAGVVVHPVGGYRYNTLINALHLRYRDTANAGRDVVPRLCHRIDKQTSGLILVAKDDQTRRHLQYQFERKSVPDEKADLPGIEKEYYAITRGTPDPREGVLDFPIGPDDGPIKIKMAVRNDGLTAETAYRVLKNLGKFALISAQPHTGRTHQIRVHFAAANCPLACDPLYGRETTLTQADVSDNGNATILLDRCALHSHRLRFFHPAKREVMELTAPLAPDMAEMVSFLEDL